MLLRPQLPCLSGVPNEQQSPGPVDAPGFGAASLSTCPPPLPVTDNPDDPTCSLRDVSHPQIHLCSQLCPVVPRKCDLCVMKRGAECAPTGCLLTCLGRVVGRGGPGLPLEFPFMDTDPDRSLAGLFETRSGQSLLSFVDPVCNPRGRARRVEKFARWHCQQEPALPRAGFFPPPLSPRRDNLFSSLHFLGVSHPEAPSQLGRYVSFPSAGETQTLSVPAQDEPLPRPGLG